MCLQINVALSSQPTRAPKDRDPSDPRASRWTARVKGWTPYLLLQELPFLKSNSFHLAAATFISRRTTCPDETHAHSEKKESGYFRERGREVRFCFPILAGETHCILQNLSHRLAAGGGWVLRPPAGTPPAAHFMALPSPLLKLQSLPLCAGPKELGTLAPGCHRLPKALPEAAQGSGARASQFPFSPLPSSVDARDTRSQGRFRHRLPLT